MPPVIPSRDDMPGTERHLVRYVLGQLTGPELDAVEDRLIADEAFFEQVEAVEAEVCDDYVAGRLSAADRSAFDARLAGNQRLQQRVAFARALSASTSHGRRTPMWWWAAAAALIVAIAGALWFTRDRSASTPTLAGGPSPSTPPPLITSTPTPTPGQPRLTPAPPTVIATITLFGPVVRDAAQAPVISIPAGPGMLRVEVALQDGDVFEAYRAEIMSQSGAPVLVADRLSPRTSASGRTVVTDVAADRLPNGPYQITVFGLRAGEASRLVTYPFRVTR